MTDSKNPAGDYEVGYGKPPREHMQKAGAPSKNPYGRKGKPENRAAIAARKVPGTMREALLKASRKHYPVRTPDGRVRKRVGNELLGEALMTDAIQHPQRALKTAMSLHKLETTKAGRPAEPERTGVILVPTPAASMEEALALAAADRSPALQEQTNSAPPLPVRDPFYPSPAPQDPVEERFYGLDPRAGSSGAQHPRERSSGLLDMPSPGRSLKADGTYR